MFKGNQQLSLAAEAAQRKAEHTLLDTLLPLIDTLASISLKKIKTESTGLVRWQIVISPKDSNLLFNPGRVSTYRCSKHASFLQCHLM